MEQIVEFAQNNFFLSGVWLALIILIIYTFVAGALSAVKELNTHQATLKINKEDAVLLDIRKPDEFKKGHDLHGDLNNNKGRYGNENDFTLIKENEMLNKKLPTPVLQDYVNVLDTFFSERRIFTKYDLTKQ